MATVGYFWHGFIHSGTTFIYLQYSHPTPYIITFCQNIWKASYTISTSIFIDVPYSKDKFISCVVLGPSQWFIHFGKEIVVAWTHIRWVWWMFQNLPLPAAQEVHDSSSSSVTPSLPCHEERWGSVLVQNGLCDCIVVSLLHLWNFLGYPIRCKFGVSQNIVQNVELSFVTYPDFCC